VNHSKCNDRRFWRLWYASGAVPQKQFRGVALTIIGIGGHYSGPAEGHSTLSLGSRIVDSGPDWSCSEPVCAVVVPTSDKYQVGHCLDRIPANAVPVGVIFPNAD
jgi:hypothetical protein